MERCARIIENREYQMYLDENEAREKERIYCGHQFDHLLTVARLTYLLLLDDGQPFISREIAYAAGLLHDIGRWKEYRDGGDHAEISAELAGPILEEACFILSERRLIQEAISQHRSTGKDHLHRSPLSKALSKADRYSRPCFKCQAKENCYKIEKQPHQRRLIY